MRRPIHEVIWQWPLSSVVTHLEFLAREPITEERIELLLARLNANYLAAHTPDNGVPPQLADFLSHRDVWERDEVEQMILNDIEAEKKARGQS